MTNNQDETQAAKIEHNTHATDYQIAETQWFEKPFGLVLIGLFMAVVGCGIARYLGWY